MANSTLLVLSLLLPSVLMSEVVRYSSGSCSYYWALYDGTIPEDAVPGGMSSSGETVYIASVHLKLWNVVLPGMIIPSIQSARIVKAGVTIDIRNSLIGTVKILRSPDKEAFEWIDTRSGDLHLLTDHHLVASGNVLGTTLYIGKVYHNGGIALGKVFPDTPLLRGLYVPSGFFYKIFTSYKILSFNSKKKKSMTFLILTGDLVWTFKLHIR